MNSLQVLLLVALATLAYSEGKWKRITGQGRIHNNTSCVMLGRGSDACGFTFWVARVGNNKTPSNKSSVALTVTIIRFLEIEVRGADDSGYIIGGQPAGHGEFPYQVF